MSIVPYERHLEPPTVKSPFRRGITGPGFVGEPKSKPTGEEDEDLDEPSKKIIRLTDRPMKINPTPPQNPVTLPSTASRPRDSRSSMPGPSQLPAQRPTIPNSMPYEGTSPNATQRSTAGGDYGMQSIGATLNGAHHMEQIAAREVLPSDTGEPAF